jgi:hypothetical protein
MKVAIVTVMAISHGLIAGFAWAGREDRGGGGRCVEERSRHGVKKDRSVSIQGMLS